MRRTPRISSYVTPIVRSTTTGLVRGVFGHGLDVLTDAGRLVYLGGFDRPLSCVGLQLPVGELLKTLPLVEAGDDVEVAEGHLGFYRQGRHQAGVDLRQVEEVDMHVKGSLDPVACNAVAAAIGKVGIARAIGLRRDTDLHSALCGLVAGGEGLYDSVRWLYGRGIGLTPSGDDVLCGYGMGLLARGDTVAHAHLVHEIREVHRSRLTTYVSDAYLRAMADGCANEGMLSLVDAARAGLSLGGPIGRARNYGHSSGDDMLLGLALALGAGVDELLDAHGVAARPSGHERDRVVSHCGGRAVIPT